MQVAIELKEDIVSQLNEAAEVGIEPLVRQFLPETAQQAVILTKVIEAAISRSGSLKEFLTEQTVTTAVVTVDPSGDTANEDGSSKPRRKRRVQTVAGDLPPNVTYAVHAKTCLDKLIAAGAEFSNRHLIMEMGVYNSTAQTCASTAIRTALETNAIKVIREEGRSRIYLKTEGAESTPPPPVNVDELIRAAHTFIIGRISESGEVSIPEVSKFLKVGTRGIKYSLVSDTLLGLMEKNVIRRADSLWPVRYVAGDRFSA